MCAVWSYLLYDVKLCLRVKAKLVVVPYKKVSLSYLEECFLFVFFLININVGLRFPSLTFWPRCVFEFDTPSLRFLRTSCRSQQAKRTWCDNHMVRRCHLMRLQSCVRALSLGCFADSPSAGSEGNATSSSMSMLWRYSPHLWSSSMLNRTTYFSFTWSGLYTTYSSS